MRQHMQLQFVSFGTDFITARMRTKVPLSINTLILLLTTKREKTDKYSNSSDGMTLLLPLSEHQCSPLSAMHFCFGHPLVMTVNKNYSVNHMTPYMLCRKKNMEKIPLQVLYAIVQVALLTTTQSQVQTCKLQNT